MANPNNISNGAGPADVTHWVYKPRFVINLVAMRYCEENCENGAWRIAKVTTEDIFFDDRANVLSFVRRENNIFHQRIDDRGKVSDLDGQCHKEKFSGMPQDTKLRN